MGLIVVLLLLALTLAAAVIVYAAYPYRGAQTPVTPRLGEAMRRGVSSLPTLGLDQQLLLSERKVAVVPGFPRRADTHR